MDNHFLSLLSSTHSLMLGLPLIVPSLKNSLSQ